MTDPHVRSDILSGGPGEPPAPRLDSAPVPGDEGDVVRLDLDADEVAPGPGPSTSHRLRALLGGLFGAESLAITGLVLAIVPSMAFTVLGYLATAMSQPETLPDGTTSREEYATALTSLSVGTAVLGIMAGFFALRRGASASRAVNGMAGAAVLIGLLTAVAHLAVEIMGGANTYY